VVDDAIVVVEAVMHHIEQGMTPKDATLKAMEEVSGPVVAIALILAAVFVPVAFIGGITGRLYQQFAITIAISVLFSAFNALTLSPALAAKLLKAKGAGSALRSSVSTTGSTRSSANSPAGYLSITSILVRKTLLVWLYCVVLVVTGALLKAFPPASSPGGQRLFLINVQLPDASSLQRTDAVCRKIEAILAETHGIDNYTTISGYSIITQVVGPNVGGFFISLKPWEERKSKAERSFELVAALNQRFAREVPEAIVYAFGPPAIQGLGTGAGFTILIQDMSGATPQDLAAMTERFVTEARKRPEIGRIATFYRASVPQVYAAVDRDKVLKQGVSISGNTDHGLALGANHQRPSRTRLQSLSLRRASTATNLGLGQFFVRT
jgi:HAE1 family hydrophobic/amphiphilic exporter-1